MALAILKNLFAGFVRSRGIGRHFRRILTLEGLRDTTVSKEVPPSLAQGLAQAATDEPAALLARLGSHADGLSDSQAETVRERIGRNVVEQEKALPWWLHLWHCYRTPFDLLLTLLAAISYITGSV